MAGMNDRYAFQIGEGSKNRFALENVILKPDWHAEPNLLERTTRLTPAHDLLTLNPNRADDTFNLSRMREHPSMSQLDWTVETKPDKVVLGIHGTLDAGVNWIRTPARLDVEAVLDASNFYVIQDSHATIRDATGEVCRWDVKNEYRIEDGWPLPTRQTLKDQTFGSSNVLVLTKTFDTYSSTYLPDPEIFYLTHYDLPEPSESRTSGSYRLPTWFWLVLGGILSILAGVGLLYVVARRK